MYIDLVTGQGERVVFLPEEGVGVANSIITGAGWPSMTAVGQERKGVQEAIAFHA